MRKTGVRKTKTAQVIKERYRKFTIAAKQSKQQSNVVRVIM